jgi:hypothetical protein
MRDYFDEMGNEHGDGRAGHDPRHGHEPRRHDGPIEAEGGTVFPGDGVAP